MADNPLQKATLGSKVGIFVMDRTCVHKLANEKPITHAPLIYFEMACGTSSVFPREHDIPPIDVVAAHHCQENKKRRMTQDQKRCI
jgi:hypothetical protein